MKPLTSICDQFNSRLTRFFDTTEDWRKESSICWEFYDAHPTQTNEMPMDSNGHAGKLNSKPVRSNGGRKAANAPVVTAYINAIVGMMERDQKRIVASSASDAGEVEETGLNKGFRYFDGVTHRRSVKQMQATAAAVTGVGGTVAHLDFTIDDAIAGQPVYEQKDILFFDRGQGGKINSDTIGWCGYAEPMYREDLQEYIARCEAESDYEGASCGTDFKSRIFEHLSFEDESELDFLYVYFWREFRKVWDVENPFLVMPEFLLMLTEEHPKAADLFAEVAEKLQLDFKQQHFVFDKDDFNEFKKLLDNIEFMTGEEIPDIEYSSRLGRAYYRAEFADGKLLKAGRSFTRQCHPMSFATAYYDRTYGYHYGPMRILGYYQKLLDAAVTDMVNYSERSSSGGNVAIKGAGDTIEVVKKALEDGHRVTPAKQGTDIINLGTPDAAQAIMGTTEMILRLMPLAIGMPPELFGMLSTGEMTDALMNKIKQQMNATLSHLYANMDRSTLTDGWIMRDLILDMAQGIKGTLDLQFVLGGEEGVFELSRKDLARNYTITLVTREATKDEELESFDKVVDMVKLLPPDAIAKVLPILIKSSPLYIGQKQEFIQALQGAQPDPAAIEMQNRSNAAQIRLVEAQAHQLEQQGEADAARAANAKQEAVLKLQSEAADIEETKSKTQKNLAELQEKGVNVKSKQFAMLKEAVTLNE